MEQYAYTFSHAVPQVTKTAVGLLPLVQHMPYALRYMHFAPAAVACCHKQAYDMIVSFCRLLAAYGWQCWD